MKKNIIYEKVWRDYFVMKIDKGFSVSFAGFGLGLNGEEKSNDSVSVIEKILTHLKQKFRECEKSCEDYKGLCICISSAGYCILGILRW